MAVWIVFSTLGYFVKVPNSLTASLQMSASLYRKDQLPTRILVFTKVTSHPFLLIAMWNLACIILHEHNFYQECLTNDKDSFITLIPTFKISSFYFSCLRNFYIKFYIAIYKITLLDLINCNISIPLFSVHTFTEVTFLFLKSFKYNIDNI